MEASSQAKKYEIIYDTSWFEVNHRGQLISHTLRPGMSSDFKKGDIVIGKEKNLSILNGSLKNDRVNIATIEISSGKYISRSAAASYSPSSERKERKCRHISPDGTVTTYECPDGNSFSGADGGVMSKMPFDKGVLVGGIGFGLVGVAISSLLGTDLKSGIGLTISGVVIGALVGHNSNLKEIQFNASGSKSKTSKRMTAGVKCCKKRDSNCRCTEYEYVKHGECDDAPC